MWCVWESASTTCWIFEKGLKGWVQQFTLTAESEPKKQSLNLKNQPKKDDYYDDKGLP